MSRQNLIAALTNDRSFLTKIAKLFIELGDFKFVELQLQLEKGSIEDLLEEDEDLCKEFDEAVRRITLKKIKRESAHKTFKLIETMYDVVVSGEDMENGGPSLSDKVKAAGILSKLLETPKEKKGDKGDEIDEILRRIEKDAQES